MAQKAKIEVELMMVGWVHVRRREKRDIKIVEVVLFNHLICWD